MNRELPLAERMRQTRPVLVARAGHRQDLEWALRERMAPDADAPPARAYLPALAASLALAAVLIFLPAPVQPPRLAIESWTSEGPPLVALATPITPPSLAPEPIDLERVRQTLRNRQNILDVLLPPTVSG